MSHVRVSYKSYHETETFGRLLDQARRQSLRVEELAETGGVHTEAREIVERQQEYPSTQAIAEVAHFFDCDGIIVPCARWPCTNVVLFCDRLPPAATEPIADHGLVDWETWQSTNRLGR